MFVLGPPGLGKRTTVNHFLGEKAAHEATPDDWCYVNNFEQCTQTLGAPPAPRFGLQVAA